MEHTYETLKENNIQPGGPKEERRNALSGKKQTPLSNKMRKKAANVRSQGDIGYENSNKKERIGKHMTTPFENNPKWSMCDRQRFQYSQGEAPHQQSRGDFGKTTLFLP